VTDTARRVASRRHAPREIAKGGHEVTVDNLGNHMVGDLEQVVVSRAAPGWLHMRTSSTTLRTLQHRQREGRVEPQ